MLIQGAIRSFVQTYPEIGESWRQAMMRGTSIVCTEFDVFCIKYKTNVVGKAVEEVILMSTPDDKKELLQRSDALPIQPRGTLLGRSRVSASEKMNTRPSAVNTKPALAPLPTPIVIPQTKPLPEPQTDTSPLPPPTLSQREPIDPGPELSICPMSREPAVGLAELSAGDVQKKDIRVDMRCVEEPVPGFTHVPVRVGDDTGLMLLVDILRESKKIPEIVCDDSMSELLTQQFQLNHIRAAVSEGKK
jgi:hypothetical protein